MNSRTPEHGGDPNSLNSRSPEHQFNPNRLNNPCYAGSLCNSNSFSIYWYYRFIPLLRQGDSGHKQSKGYGHCQGAVNCSSCWNSSLLGSTTIKVIAIPDAGVER
ncbi:hypothetical protein GC093_01995 [Paenibacillus sp. LMG 31456]|uniref:Uncharacterized protein n=1 Tax=Paenibacillus foliorum TaxID=2654974 RepID=A0A972GKI1_9BACL|nr:hypothetical protein [Paenibacillus foliorum]NOU92008.1 hypothetical protein [Paenibacillus foliorum]